MIHSINITNFQSHKNSSLKFCDGVNVIIGQSDSGKTAILRALKWLVENRPSGEAFRSSWGGDTNVNIEIDPLAPDFGYTEIYRLKGANKNTYAVGNNMLGVLEEYKAFGQDVPEEIRKALNLDSVNMQSQMDAPFLLSDSSAEVARYLNKVTRLDVIDRTVSNLLKKSRVISQSIASETVRAKELEEELERWGHLKTAEDKLIELENLQKKVDSDKTAIISIETYIAKFDELVPVIVRCERLLTHEQSVNDLVILNEKINQDKRYQTVLNSIVCQYDISKASLEKLENVLKYETRVKELLVGYDKLADEKKSKQKLEEYLEDLNIVQSNIKGFENEIKSRQAEFDRLMPETCPLCGRS